jgi:hypothetical protein
MSNLKYGLSVMGKIRVFTKSKEIQAQGSKKKYTINDVWFNVSEKEENGGYFNKSMNLIFKKGSFIPNNTVINIISAFPMITGNGDYRRISLFVEAWEEVQEND